MVSQLPSQKDAWPVEIVRKTEKRKKKKEDAEEE